MTTINGSQTYANGSTKGGEAKVADSSTFWRPQKHEDFHYTRNTMSKSNALQDEDLNYNEKKFLLAVEQGDTTQVKFYIEHSGSLNVNTNCTDPWGRTAPVIAIENRNLDLLKLLLASNLEIGDSLLHAINAEDLGAVDLILEVLHSRTHRKKDLMKVFGELPSQKFSADITPLMLAAHTDNYPIIKILLQKNYSMSKPHEMTCSCHTCRHLKEDVNIRQATARYHAYQALASPTLICLTSKDPILSAFELSLDLMRLSVQEFEFKSEYIELATQCRKFAKDLLSETRNSNELAVVLNHEAGSLTIDELMHRAAKEDTTGASEHAHGLHRLKLGIAYQQKEFVAHPHTQYVATDVWFNGLDGFREKSVIGQLTTSAMYMFTFPLWASLNMMGIEGKYAEMINCPFVRFLCHTGSYLLFLLLLILHSIRFIELVTGGIDLEGVSRGELPDVIEIIIVVFVIGYVWQNMVQLYRVGWKRYVSNVWNVVSFAELKFYVCVIGLRIAAYYEVQWELAHGYDLSAEAHRAHWNAYDPTVVSESMFAFGNIISVLKLIQYFTIFNAFGPLQVTFGRIMIDIVRFLILFGLVVVAFACGLANMLYYYAYYFYEEECDPAHGGSPTSEECLTDGTNWLNIFNIAQTLFWGIYGLSYKYSLHNNLGASYTEFLSMLLFGVYCFIGVFVLLNLIISLMNQSFAATILLADTEWKFARADLWLQYASEDCGMPVPLNLLPSVKMMQSMGKRMQRLFSKQAEREQFDRQRLTRIEDKQKEYDHVIENLIRRYLIKRVYRHHKTLINHEDIDDIKQDLYSFRYEVINTLHTNGLNIPEYCNDNLKSSQFGRRRQHISTFYRQNVDSKVQHAFDALSGKWKTIGRDEDPADGLVDGLLSEFSEFYNGAADGAEISAGSFTQSESAQQRDKKLQYVSVMHFAKKRKTAMKGSSAH